MNKNDLRFNLTEEMNNMFIEIIITHQMLEDSLKEDSSNLCKIKALNLTRLSANHIMWRVLNIALLSIPIFILFKFP